MTTPPPAIQMLIYCQHCGEIIGCYEPMPDQVWIRLGGAVLYSAHGVCNSCGEEWHWSYSEKSINVLICRRRKDELPYR